MSHPPVLNIQIQKTIKVEVVGFGVEFLLPHRLKPQSGPFKPIPWALPPYSNCQSINGAALKGLIYPYYEYYSTVTEWGQHPALHPKSKNP